MRRLLLLALVLGAAACGDGEDAPLDAPVVIDAACSILGNYGVARNDAGFRNGVSFRSDGFFTITRSIGAQVIGTYVVSGSTVTFTDQLGEPPGVTCTVPGSYTFTLSGDCRTIGFVVSADSCLARTSILHNASFTRD